MIWFFAWVITLLELMGMRSVTDALKWSNS